MLTNQKIEIMECKKINAEALRKMLGLDEMSPAQLARIQGGELKEICKKCGACGEAVQEDDDLEL